jgi:hypothetical protein
MKTVISLLYFPVFLLALAAGGQTLKKTALVMEAVPYFEKPEQGLLPKGYLGKRDTCIADSTFIDSAGVAWFRVQTKSSSGWALAHAMRYVSDIPADFFSTVEKGDQDKKHRGDIVKSHPEWPLRIKKAVRSGQVCLDMSSEQLVASWGEPLEKQKTFMLGVGEYISYIYKCTARGSLLVCLQNNRIIGWSLEE